MSCNSASERHDNNYFKFSKSLKTIDYGTRTSAQEFKTEACNKLVVLINADCSLCYSEIWQWEKLVRKHEFLQKVPLAFIIYGETFKPNLRLMKGSGMLRLTFLRDSLSSTLKGNSLERDKFFNSFLLDKNNRIVIRGNPTLSEKVLHNYILYFSEKDHMRIDSIIH